MFVLLTDDNYLSSGLESLSSHWFYSMSCRVIILDDGFNFLYFIDATNLIYERLVYESKVEVVSFFLESLKLVVPRNSSMEKIQSEINKIKNGLCRRLPLTPREYVVLLGLANYSPDSTPWSIVGMKYKTWHSFKASGYLRLGIKNNANYIHAIYAIKRHQYKLYSIFKPRIVSTENNVWQISH